MTGLRQESSIVDRAVRLFTFLGRAQQLKSPSVRDIDTYRRDGAVHWWHDLPDHPAVSTGQAASLLTVERIPVAEPPEPDSAHHAWLDGSVDDPGRRPELRSRLQKPSTSYHDEPEELFLDDHPEVVETHSVYLRRWDAWAEQERRDAPVREFYAGLFTTYVKATGHPEELELVVGAGLLAWKPADHPAVRRHLLTTAAQISFNEDTARLTVAVEEAADGTHVELDMLDPGLVRDPAAINVVRDRARDSDEHPLDRDHVGELARRIVHLLTSDAEYRDDVEPALTTTRPVGAFAPALVLRRRSQQGLVEVFRTLVDQIEATGIVPPGIRPLVDPDEVPHVDRSAERADGALVHVDDEPFLPLPVNAVQLRILRQVDTHAQTLVQGPPGTGKTHTAAVLISHLLAQGKRVLVTAHTDRALKEVRSKLPEPIRPLAVSVVGSGREDMSDLRVAVERIAATAGEFDADEAAQAIAGHLSEIDVLRRRRAALQNQLDDARQTETRQYQVVGYHGTAATIAAQLEIERPRYGWIDEFVSPATEPPPLDGDAVRQWHAALLDADLIRDEPSATMRLIEPAEIADGGRFAGYVATASHAHRESSQFDQLRLHHAYVAIERMAVADRDALAERFRSFIAEMRALAERPERWMSVAMGDVLDGRPQIWATRRDQVGAILERAKLVLNALGPVTDVKVDGSVAGLDDHAQALLEHLAAGNVVKTGPDGSPKSGMLTPRPIKEAAGLFARVRVDGTPPVTTPHLAALRHFLEAMRLVEALDRAWPAGTVIAQGSLSDRVHQHAAEHVCLQRLLRLGAELAQEEQRWDSLGLPPINWRDARSTSAIAELPDAIAAATSAQAAEADLANLEFRIADVNRWPDAEQAVSALLDACRGRDSAAYTAAHARIDHLHTVRRKVAIRNAARNALAAAAPALVDAAERDPGDATWPIRLDAFEEAWAWAAAGQWLDSRTAADIDGVQQQIRDVEDAIRDNVQGLSATRAWGHAVHPERLTPRSKASLQQYATLVRRFGKTGGKYREQRRAEIRAALDRCRSSVPVWIMPIYRIADQLRIEPGMFDVVIVDEASQAGTEATFLQYLAPRIVVVGDDRQVSPAAVGVDQQQLRDLASQYLYDDQYRASWQDPQHSLFDEAKMRYGGTLTLTEHRRCVPEIINFSNRIAYEPDGVRLVPVRQFGPDRLEPIRPVFVPEGYERGGTGTKINPAEIDAVVDQVEKCLADDRYDGLTFGVISLLGPTQAKAIEKKLLERLSPEQWVERDLRCGDAADFQGSERDVMFLSMVAAPAPDRRLMPLTAAMYVQRYNVAVSRAKDQFWLFHSIPLEQLSNVEDMRFQLLDYCYGIQNRRSADDDRVIGAPVREDVLVPPFQSRFEQRVCNKISDRAYSVVPQYPALGYSIDLVVVGAHSRLAVECDGDYWHGPDAYQRDMARQRELERCGWTFARVLESDFIRDPKTAMAPVWERLEELEIHPSGWRPPSATEEPHPRTGRTPAPSPARATPATVDEPPTDPAELDTFDSPSLADPPVVDDQRLTLAEYTSFEGTLPAVMRSSRKQLFDGIVAIVAVEGPIVGDRLHNVYARCSRDQGTDPQVAKVLNATIFAAVREGLLIEHDPLGEAGIKPHTFRLPAQPAVQLRELGPRNLSQVPPAELAAVIRDVGDQVGWDDIDVVMRQTAIRYGLDQLGASVEARLSTLTALASPRGRAPLT